MRYCYRLTNSIWSLHLSCQQSWTSIRYREMVLWITTVRGKWNCQNGTRDLSSPADGSLNGETLLLCAIFLEEVVFFERGVRKNLKSNLLQLKDVKNKIALNKDIQVDHTLGIEKTSEYHPMWPKMSILSWVYRIWEFCGKTNLMISIFFASLSLLPKGSSIYITAWHKKRNEIFTAWREYFSLPTTQEGFMMWVFKSRRSLSEWFCQGVYQLVSHLALRSHYQRTTYCKWFNSNINSVINTAEIFSVETKHELNGVLFFYTWICLNFVSILIVWYLLFSLVIFRVVLNLWVAIWETH